MTLLDPALRAEAQRARLEAALRWNVYMGGHVPTLPQRAFLLAPHKEVLYGGATKGGKSDALLMAALQYVDVPYYNALILHRSFADLNKGDALIPRFREWTSGLGVRWDDENHAGIFPSGAKVSFGFIEAEGAGRRYKGPNYQFIGWEELTEQPTPTDYVYLFSRLSRPAGSAVPLRVRATTNPDGPGRQWVKDRWGIGRDAPPCPPTRLFIPAKLDDNPYVDEEAVEASLSELGAVEYAQLREGNWDVTATGDLFRLDRLQMVPLPTAGVIARLRGWDKASTPGAGPGANAVQRKRSARAKFTVGMRMSRVSKALYGVEYVVEHVIRGQWSSGVRDRVIRETAGVYKPEEDTEEGRKLRIVPVPDPPGTEIMVEREPGSGGQQSAEITVADLAGRVVHVYLPGGDKIDRARPFATQVEHGNVGYVAGPWTAAMLDEWRAAPNGLYWDHTDTAGMLFNALRLLPTAGEAVAVPGRARTIAAGLR